MPFGQIRNTLNAVPGVRLGVNGLVCASTTTTVMNTSRPTSPSPSTPSSGDEEIAAAESLNQNAPKPKRRAVASATSAYPQQAGARSTRSNTRQKEDSKGKGPSTENRFGISSGSGFATGMKDEMADVALRDELRQRALFPFLMNTMA